MLSIANYLGKTVLVSMPRIAKDEQPHAYKVVGTEPYGLWLEAEAGGNAFAALSGSHSRTALVPFTQIEYVICESEPAVTVPIAPVVPIPVAAAVPIPTREVETSDTPVNQEEVAKLAFGYWQARGCPEGSSNEDWVRAEAEWRSQLHKEAA